MNQEINFRHLLNLMILGVRGNFRLKKGISFYKRQFLNKFDKL